MPLALLAIFVPLAHFANLPHCLKPNALQSGISKPLRQAPLGSISELGNHEAKLFGGHGSGEVPGGAIHGGN